MAAAVDKLSPATQWELPPLILHPFADRAGAERIRSVNVAACALNAEQSLALPDQELTRRLLDSRYTEFRMLCFIGKDVGRWLEQCIDFVHRTEALDGRGIRPQSFASLLVDHPPASVDAKLRGWGVTDYRSIFVRAIGLNAVFPHAPEQEVISEGFLRSYQRFAEYLYACRRQLEPYTELDSSRFRFEIYSSGEYSRMLEEQWSA